MPVSSLVALPVWGCGTEMERHQTLHGVTKLLPSRSVLERRTAEGKSPVCERHAASVSAPE